MRLLAGSLSLSGAECECTRFAASKRGAGRPGAGGIHARVATVELVPKTSCAVLLRAINVGGRNKVPMTELRECLSGLGLGDVSTYIQSGNVVCRSSLAPTELAPAVEDALEKRFGFPVPVVVRSRDEMSRVIGDAPEIFDAPKGTFHCDVIFLRPELSTEQAMSLVKLRDGVDQAWEGHGVMYFARLSEQRAKSRLSSLVSTPEYKLMTIRNWATTRKVHEMLQAL